MINPPLPPPGRDPRQRPAVPVPPAEPLRAAPVSSTPVPLPVAPPPLPARRVSRNRQELTQRQRDVTAADEAGFATLERELGGRPALVAILAGADLNADEGKIVGLLADPENDRLSLAKVCIGGGLSMGRLMKLFQAAALAKGQVKAIQRVAAKLPDVAAGVMDDAVAGERPCGRCNGLGWMPEKPGAPDAQGDPGPSLPCPDCYGKGTVIHAPDHQVREMALRIGGLLEKGGGGAKILIANQNNGGGVADSASFDKLMSSLDTALYGEGRGRSASKPPAVDGEVID